MLPFCRDRCVSVDNHQRNAYGTTRWTTDYSGRNPVEGVNGMIKQDGSFEPRSCRAFGLAPTHSPPSGSSEPTSAGLWEVPYYEYGHVHPSGQYA